MLRTTAASLLALGCAATAAQAQTVLYGEPTPAPQPYYVDPRPVPQPFPSQPTQPLYYEPTAPAPQPTQPFFVDPPQQGVIFDPQPQPSRSFQPVPQQGLVPTRPLGPVEPYRAPADSYRAPATETETPATPPEIARPEPREPAPRRAGTDRPSVREAVRAEIVEPSSPAATESEALREFSDELARIVSLGERYRAASPGFLEDLKALSDRYRDLPVRADTDASDPERTAELIGPPPPPEPPAVDEPVDTAPPTPEPEQQIAALPEPPESPVAEPIAEPATAPEPAPEVELPQPLPPTSAAVVYLRDDFSDGDFQFNPAWNVRQGQWTVDPAFGLRPAAPEAAEPAQVTPQALLQYLIGDEKPETREASGDTGAALIEAETNIGNAFSLVTTITDHGGEGAAHFIIHQGGANWLGYRLELRAGPRPLVVLARRGSSGYKDIMKVEAPAFSTGKPHQLRWARLSDGQMFVLIDGKPVITARDTVFRQPWTGFGYFTADADISMRNIRIAEPVER